MRKLFSKRIFILAITLITCFSSITAFSQDFVFANESETTSSETVLVEAATLSGEASTEAQETESESQSETAENENDSQTEATEDTTETEVTYSKYDDQPTTMAEIQAWIDAYTESGYSFDAKPRWQYEVDSTLMPSGWRCVYVEDEKYSEGKYWTVFPKPTFKALNDGAFNVYDTDTFITGFNTLSDAISYVNGGTVNDAGGTSEAGNPATPYTIKVKADTTLAEMLLIANTGGVTITTDSSATSMVTIARTTTTSANDTRHFKVESKGKLILENIILKGDWDGVTDTTATGGGGVWVVEDSALVLDTGAEITNCYRSNVSVSGVNTGGSGGAVYVDQGTFTMNDGKIDGNFASALGGGVCVGNSAFDFTTNTSGTYMTESNAASKFYMYGGAIEGNTATNAGGGVAVRGNTYFEMNGSSATIADNTTYASSGGVAVEFSTFVLANGSITGNKATAGSSATSGSTNYNSGGVGIVASKFTMSGGSISDNSAKGSGTSDPEGYGGGVWVGYAPKSVYTSGTLTGNDFPSLFTMTAGEISGNYATRSGGGVLVVGGSTFNMSGGEIYNNETGSKGGGVTVSAYAYFGDTDERTSYFNLLSDNAKIYGNYATKQGGGVAVNASEFTMSGGNIYGNVTTDQGGGVWVGKFEGTGASSKFTMSGGTVGNKTIYEQTTMTTTTTPTAIDASNAGENGEGNYAAAFGGGVFVGDGTTFTMSDGSVQSNKTSSRAGGVGVKRSYFEMSGNAAISSNYASLSGGGVSVASSTFWMNGGTIDGDNTGYSAGGVRVGHDTEAYNDANGNATQEEENTLAAARTLHGDKSYFYMTDGKITDNEATYCGGGVIVRDGAEFYMGSGSYDHDNKKFTSGGSGSPTISKNNAHYAGGGVFLGTFETRDGAPYPTFYKDSAKFYMYDGAVIDDNQTEWVTGTYGQWLYGGGVHVNWGSEFEMNGGDIINNTAAYCGGGVSVAGATFTMKGGNISGNSTKTSYNNPSGTDLVAYGGGVWIGHAYTMDEDGDGDYTTGASHPASSTFTMTGGIIGGADGLLTAASSGGGTYYGNHAEDDGGGVYVGGDSHFIMSGDAQINHNDTENSGGGVYVGSGDFGTDRDGDGIADSSFIMENGYILNNTSYFDGGGVMVKGATFNMFDGYISGNTTTDATATSGGVYVGQITNDYGTYYGNFTMTGGVVGGLDGYYNNGNSKVGGPYNGNHAVSSGGGVYVTNDATFTMSGEAQINYNETELWGGGVYVTVGEKGTGKTSFTMETGYILNNKAINDAGGLYLSGIEFTLKDGCYISGNIASTYKGAIRATSGGLFVETYTNDAGTTYRGKLTIEGGLIGGTAKYDGTPSVMGKIYYGNFSAYYGGGVAALNADITMTGGSIANNKAYNGGGVFLFGSNLTMTNAEISENMTTNEYGGGVSMCDVSTLPADIGSISSGTSIGPNTMIMNTGATVQKNLGQSYGGGVYNAGTLIMNTGSLVDNNTSNLGAGGIYTPVNGTLIMEAGSVVSNNNATSGYGGGVSIVYGTINMKKGALITGNTNSALNGGGIFLQANTTTSGIANIIAGDVTNNTAANYGGGISIVGASSPTSYTITGTISGNKAANYGGGIYYTSTLSTANTTVNVSGAAITANRANYGGGIYTTGTTVLNVSGAAITANRAIDGGGIYYTATSALTAFKVSVSGTAITANMVSNNGGGIYTAATRTKSLTVSGSTQITNNVAQGNGGGIYTTNTTTYSNLDITDTSTTFSGNRAAYATDTAVAANYKTYVSDLIPSTALSVYTYALNNYDINYAGTPTFYTIILGPNGGTFEGSVENLGYLYVAAGKVGDPLSSLGYEINPSTNMITYNASNDNGNAAVVGLELVESGVAVTPTKDGSNLTMWTTDSTNLTTSINLASTAYYSAGAVGTDLATSTGTSATASSIYAQWVTYSVTLALDDGITWAELADNVAVTFTNTSSNASMTVLFTDPSKKPGNYYTIYPGTGALNGIPTLGATDTWNVTADLPLSGQYYIKGITIDNGSATSSSVTPNNAESCVIVITIGKTATPWGHWIYTSQ